MKYLKLIIFGCGSLFSCDPNRPIINIINNSEETIIAVSTCMGESNCDFNTEEKIPFNGKYAENPFYGKSGDTIKLSSYGWAICDTINILIVNKNLIEKIGWDQICQKQLYDTIYSIDIGNLKDYWVSYK